MAFITQPWHLNTATLIYLIFCVILQGGNTHFLNMWLLNATSLQLEYFVDSGDRRIPYAILSHTWEDEELTFQEMKSGSGKNKKGYWKIAKTCEQALRSECNYAWIDTCCINKESSAELSEAINSMWKWYCDARVCYAYLSDVGGDCPMLKDCKDNDSSDGERGLDEGSVDPWHAAFRRSRWFTRGWTLQELIAPSYVKFFGHNWNFLGSKRALIQTICEVTGIDQLALEHHDNLPVFAIARKMSWAAGRQTSRIEDRAYSLLGIFEVNMPLLYGEGSKAFTRLQEELIRTSTDHSVLAWETEDPLALISWNDKLFARSPDDYWMGKTVVPWHVNLVNSNYRLTNRGLLFNSAICPQRERGYLCVLNCRFEDNLRGPIALRLSKGSDWNTKNDNMFWIGEFDDRLRRTQRVMVYNDFDMRNLQPQEITLCRNDISQRVASLQYYRLPQIWLRGDKSSLEDFDIILAYPGRLWNRQTGVLCFRASKRPPPYITGSVTVRFRKSGSILSIAFSSVVSRRNKLAEEQFRIDVTKTPDHGAVRQRLKNSDPRKIARLLDEKGACYSAAVKVERAMGDEIYTILVSVR